MQNKTLKVKCKCLIFWSEIELFELFWTLLAVSSARPSLYNLHLTFEWFPISPKLVYILSKHFEIKLLEAFPRPKKTRSHSFLLSTAGESKKTLKDSKLNFFQNCVHVSPQWVWKLELHEPGNKKFSWRLLQLVTVQPLSVCPFCNDSESNLWSNCKCIFTLNNNFNFKI